MFELAGTLRCRDWCCSKMMACGQEPDEVFFGETDCAAPYADSVMRELASFNKLIDARNTHAQSFGGLGDSH